MFDARKVSSTDCFLPSPVQEWVQSDSPSVKIPPSCKVVNPNSVVPPLFAPVLPPVTGFFSPLCLLGFLLRHSMFPPFFVSSIQKGDKSPPQGIRQSFLLLSLDSLVRYCPRPLSVLKTPLGRWREVIIIEDGDLPLQFYSGAG